MVFYRDREESHKGFHLYLGKIRSKDSASEIAIDENFKTYTGFTTTKPYRDTVGFRIISINEYLKGLKDLNRTNELFEAIFQKLWKHI